MSVLLVVAATAGGCGGGSSARTSHKSPPPSTASKTAYIARADSICRTFNARLAPVVRAIDRDVGRTPQNLPGAVRALERAQALVRAGLAQLHNLAPPPGDEARIASMFAAVSAETDEIGGLANAVRRKDAATVVSLDNQIKANATRYKGLAKAYGFEECGSHIALGG